MSDKPDVAAEMRWAFEDPMWADHCELRKEITRLVAERDALAEGRDGAFDLLADRERELSEAKAEIARLRNDTIEECARIAESGLTLNPDNGKWIAQNIRALKPDTGE